jgi:hypothetical protein
LFQGFGVVGVSLGGFATRDGSKDLVQFFEFPRHSGFKYVPVYGRWVSGGDGEAKVLGLHSALFVTTDEGGKERKVLSVGSEIFFPEANESSGTDGSQFVY